jgi:uncharacterized protein (DUF1501 family)
VPVSLNPYYTRRSGLALQANQCISLAGANAWNTPNYMLHPSMPNIAAMWQAGQVAAVNRVGYPQADLSHFVSQDIFSLGVRGSFAPLHVPDSGWIARFCDKYAPTPLGAVCVNVGRPLDIVGGTTSPLPVSSLAAFKLLGAGASGNTASRTRRRSSTGSAARAAVRRSRRRSSRRTTSRHRCRRRSPATRARSSTRPTASRSR